jgi:hypothetical protein
MGVPTTAARGAAIRQHLQDSPAPIVADALGYHPVTTAKLATETGTTATPPATTHSHHGRHSSGELTTVEYASSAVRYSDSLIADFLYAA